MRTRSRTRAQSLIETVVGCIFLIPIVLFLFDVFAIIMANQTHDTLLKDAARAGASGSTLAEARNNVTRVVNTFSAREFASGGGIVRGVSVRGTWTDRNGAGSGFGPISGGAGPGVVAAANSGPATITLRSQMVIRLPVPIPGFATNYNFQASAIEPVVGLPP
jgi:Flp pilus assembly protein TadG